MLRIKIPNTGYGVPFFDSLACEPPIYNSENFLICIHVAFYNALTKMLLKIVEHR